MVENFINIVYEIEFRCAKYNNSIYEPYRLKSLISYIPCSVIGKYLKTELRQNFSQRQKKDITIPR